MIKLRWLLFCGKQRPATKGEEIGNCQWGRLKEKIGKSRTLAGATLRPNA
ncbi:MAG: hypothetical protein U0X75_16520 [Acidobacteriota bacterium]